MPVLALRMHVVLIVAQLVACLYFCALCGVFNEDTMLHYAKSVHLELPHLVSSSYLMRENET